MFFVAMALARFETLALKGQGLVGRFQVRLCILDAAWRFLGQWNGPRTKASYIHLLVDAADIRDD